MTHSPCRRLRLAVLAATLLLLAACASTGDLLVTASSPAGSPPSASASPVSPAPTVALAEPAAPARVTAPGVIAVAPEPVPVPVDPLRPDVRLDLDDRSAQTDLWARVRRGFAMPDLDTELVRNREQWYATRPDYVQIGRAHV